MYAYNIYTGQPVRRQRSPLEENVYLLPKDSTEVAPPEFDTDKETCVFNGVEWIIAKITTPEPIAEPEPTYQEKRLTAYGSPHEQLEFITEKGLTAWKSRVAEIKKQYPKE
jgi:hypothetical protein|tara:strand:+ start:607 stop:939 length:333 start_codon:yes stop_codon:yes gene_type:complete